MLAFVCSFVSSQRDGYNFIIFHVLLNLNRSGKLVESVLSAFEATFSIHSTFVLVDKDLCMYSRKWKRNEAETTKSTQWTSIMFDDRITNHWINYREQFSSSKCLLQNPLPFENLLTVESSYIAVELKRRDTNDCLVRYLLSLLLISVANIIDPMLSVWKKSEQKSGGKKGRNSICFEGCSVKGFSFFPVLFFPFS